MKIVEDKTRLQELQQILHTIQNGGIIVDEDYPGTSGGGISCINTSPQLFNLIIKNNTASGHNGYGGGIYFKSSNAYLKNAEIKDNVSFFFNSVWTRFATSSVKVFSETPYQ